MRPGRRSPIAAALAVLAVLLAAGGCARPVGGAPSAGRGPSLPGSVEELGSLIVTDVPSGLPRLPDRDLTPPAGAKRVEDVAGYSSDPARERLVLKDFGYLHGWERFWGEDGGPVTGVFVDQFGSRAGATAYAEDRARNDAERYGGALWENPAGLPGGCRLLTVADPDPGQLHGPAASAWCAHGVFSVAATAVTQSLEAAEDEVRAVLTAQLERLPPR